MQLTNARKCTGYITGKAFPLNKILISLLFLKIEMNIFKDKKKIDSYNTNDNINIIINGLQVKGVKFN